MNIFLFELKAYRKHTILWTCALVVLMIMFMSMFPIIVKEIDEFTKVLEGFPEGIRNALGIQVDAIGSVNGYYAYTFLYITLCGAIQAMTLGISIGSKEIRERTADFLFTKPVTRTKVLFSKWIAAITSLFFTNIIYITAAVIVTNIVANKEFSLTAFMLISLSLLFIGLITFALGMVFAVLFPKIKSVISVSLGIVFMLFVIGMVAATDAAGRYFTPFKYVDYMYVINEETYEWSFLFVGVIIIFVSFITSFIIYKKRNIHTV